MAVRHRIVLAACLTLAAIVLSACTAGVQAPRCDDAPPPTVRLAVANPMMPRVTNFAIISNAFSTATLLALDRRGEPRPALASAWHTDDRRTWTLTIRDGLHSHDGLPLTAGTIRSALLPRIPGLAGYSPVWRDVERIDAPGPSTLVFRLSRPSSALPEALAEWAVSGETDRPALDAGPFRVTGETEDEVSYGAFPGFWNGPPKVAGLRVRFHASERAAWAAFLRNEADVLYQVPWEVVPLLARDPDVQLYDGGARHVAVLGFQQRHPILRDVRVRRALNLAVDRDEIARRVLPGATQTERGPFSPAYWAAQEAGESTPPDSVAARALLAGVTAGGRKPLELECLTSSEFANVSEVAAALEAQLLRVHVRLKLRALPSQELYRRLAVGQFELFVMPMQAGYTGLWPYLFWHSRAPHRFLHSGYSAADAALDAWYTAGSRDAERDGVRAVLEVMRRDPPAVFLGPLPSMRAVRRTWQVPEDDADIRRSLPRWTLAAAEACRDAAR